MSQKFQDRHGNEWDMALNLGLITTVREELEIDLGLILTDQVKLAKLLYEDINSFGKLVYTICAENSSKEIDPIAFAKGFDGATLESARKAMVASIANFFQPPAIAQAAIAGMEKVMNAKINLAVAKINQAADSMSNDSDTNLVAL